MSSFDTRGGKHKHNSNPSSRPNGEDQITNPFNDDSNNDGTSRQSDNWWDYDGASNSFLPPPSATSRMTQWPASKIPSEAKLTQNIHREVDVEIPDGSALTYTPSRKISTRRQKSQNGKAGNRVTTNFSRRMPRSTRPHVRQKDNAMAVQLPITNPFVDIITLQALENDTIDSNYGFWQSMRGFLPGKADDTNPTTTCPSDSESPKVWSSSNVQRQAPVPPRTLVKHDASPVSPNEGSIVIALSVPPSKLALHVNEPQSAVSEFAEFHSCSPNLDKPGTPSIIVTPVEAIVDNTHLAGPDARVSSIVHSSCTRTHNERKTGSVVRNPFALPEQQIKLNQRVATDRRSENNVFPSTAVDYFRSRQEMLSVCTKFEEDDQPILQSGSIPSASEIKCTEISPLTRRASKGWWNYITTPFTSRPTTFTTHHRASEEPTLPTITTNMENISCPTKIVDMTERSTFSPETPYTSTTIESDDWWDSRHNADCASKTFDSRFPLPKEIPIYSSQETSSHTATMSESSRQRAELGSVNSSRNDRMRAGYTRSTSIRPASARAVPTMADVSSFGIVPLQSQDVVTSISTEQRSHVTSNATTPDSSRDSRHRTRVAAMHNSMSGPPAYSSPEPPRIPQYRAIYSIHNNILTMASIKTIEQQTKTMKTAKEPHVKPVVQQPESPSPLTPGLIQAMTLGNALPMSDVPLTPFRSRQAFNLNPTSGHATQHGHYTASNPPTSKTLDHERHKPSRSAFNKNTVRTKVRAFLSKFTPSTTRDRPRKRRRKCYLCLAFGFLLLMILIVVLATTITRTRSPTPSAQSPWVNLTNFPPIPTGLSSIPSTINYLAYSGCVFPSTLWSCALPPPSIPSDLPFLIHIQWDNSSAANMTFANITRESSSLTGTAASPASSFLDRLLVRRSIVPLFTPNPLPPSYAETWFLGNTTDNITSTLKAGEATPFYMTFLSPNTTNLLNSRSIFPNLTAAIPPPPPELLPVITPLVTQQPLRLYDRDLPTEHYSFSAFYNKTLFLTSLSTTIPPSVISTDVPGGTTLSKAKYVCTWTQTRFLVRIWTRSNGTESLLNTTSTITTSTTPYLFPYPITLTIDRHGGSPTKKSVSCYNLTHTQESTSISDDTGVFILEHRANGGNGIVINPAPGIFDDEDDGNAKESQEQGFDGGTTGCTCGFTNFLSTRKQ